MQELRAHPESGRRRFLLAGCPAIQDPFPLGPVLDIVRRVRGELAGVPLSPVTGALRQLLPELSDLLPPLPESMPRRSGATPTYCSPPHWPGGKRSSTC